MVLGGVGEMKSATKTVQTELSTNLPVPGSRFNRPGEAPSAAFQPGAGTSFPTAPACSPVGEAIALDTECRGLGSPEKGQPSRPAIQAKPDVAFAALNPYLSSLIEQTTLSGEPFNGLYEGKDAHRIGGYRDNPVIAVKHLAPAELFSLKAFINPARVSLGGFLNRYNHPNQTWMKEQWHYLETAVLAAAHDCLVPLFETAEGLSRISVDDYDAIRFLKCGRVTKAGFFDCGDVCRCPSCNNQMRVEPVKAEFLSAFGHELAPFWSGVTFGVTNNPETAGVHVEVGRDENGDPIYEDLFLLKELGAYPRLKRFGTDAVDNVVTVVNTVFKFAHWLTLRGPFDGIGLVGDVDFNFYPDSSRPDGCNHSIFPHGHGIANMPRLLSRPDAEMMFHQFLKMLIKEGSGHLVGYPDICLKPCATAEELEKAINYALKPFKLAKFYIEGLSRGCPVVGLNVEFHQNAWNCERIFRGSNRHMLTFGNMHINAGPNYVGQRQYRKMTKKQVKKFFEKLERDEASRGDILRYENHQKAKEQDRLRKLERERRRQARHFERVTASPSEQETSASEPVSLLRQRSQEMPSQVAPPNPRQHLRRPG